MYPVLPSTSALHGLGRVGSGGAYRGPLDAGADADDAIPTRPQHPLTNPLPHNCHNPPHESVKISRDETRPNNNDNNKEMQCAREERAGSRRGKGEGSGRALPIEARRNAGGGGRRGAAEAIGVFVTEPFLPSLSLSGCGRG
jgi:hypothetical protein